MSNKMGNNYNRSNSIRDDSNDSFDPCDNRHNHCYDRCTGPPGPRGCPGEDGNPVHKGRKVFKVALVPQGPRGIHAVYRTNIHSHVTAWSVGRQGYNNYDINQDGAPFPPLEISDSALLIGNGTDDSSRSNAFIFDFNGNAFAQGTFAPIGADYAEMFEWADGNPTDEDRVGYFVTLEGGKIRKANAEDEFVLGVVSGDN